MKMALVCQEKFTTEKFTTMNAVGPTDNKRNRLKIEMLHYQVKLKNHPFSKEVMKI